MLPSREDTAAELARLRDLGAAAAASEVAQFIAAECRIAHYALVEGSAALAADRRLTAAMYLRVAAEFGLRLRWLCGDDETPNELGRLSVDREVVASRVRRLRRRDLEHLAATYDAIHRGESGHTLSANLRAMAEGLSDEIAPRPLDQLATTKHGDALYRGHRVASAQIHAGAVLSQGVEVPHLPIDSMLGEAAFLCAAAAEAALRSQGIDTGQPFPWVSGGGDALGGSLPP